VADRFRRKDVRQGAKPEAAFLSPKTVEKVLSRVYRKLGIGSRAELGARMAATPTGGLERTAAVSGGDDTPH
jgi:hypothetical protein